MPHSKFSEKPAFNENHGFLKCTCGQFLEFYGTSVACLTFYAR